MANASWVVEPVLPYLPECSAYDAQDFWDNFDSRGVKFNLSDPGTYVLDEVFPSLIPGIVLGALSLIGFVAFVLWMSVSCCISCCRCCCTGKGKKQGQEAAANEAGAAEQFISSQGSGQASALPSASPYGPPPGAKPGRKCLTKSNLFWAFYIALALATLGIAAWGLASSINSTDTTVSDFWDLVHDAQGKVENTINDMAELQQETSNLANASQVLADPGNQQAATNVLVSLGVSESAAGKVMDALDAAPTVLSTAPAGVGTAIDFLQQNVNQTIADIEDQFEPPTMAIQETWRFIPIAVVFGLLILLVLLVTVACWFMTWPKTASLLVALLWLIIALLMLLGTGLMRGLHTVTGDSCMYAETFAVDVARRKLAASPWAPLVVSMIKYYVGGNVTAVRAMSVSSSSSSGSNLTVPAALEPLMVWLPQDSREPVVKIFNLIQDVAEDAPKLEQIANNAQLLSQLKPGLAFALNATGHAVGLMKYALGNLTELANQRNVVNLYQDTKEYICCNLSNSAWDVWVAWTVAGCLSFVLALLCSAIVVRTAMALKKRYKPDQDRPRGGAVLWAPPPPAGGSGSVGGKEPLPQSTKASEYGEPAPPAPLVQPYVEPYQPPAVAAPPAIAPEPAAAAAGAGSSAAAAAAEPASHFDAAYGIGGLRTGSSSGFAHV